MRSPWLDKEWNEIDALTWGRLHEDESYMRIGSDNILDCIWVSTVWLGINTNFRPEGPPIIFETMVFAKHDMNVDLWCQRYSTEFNAKLGHDYVVGYLSDPDNLLALVRGIDDGRTRHGMVTQVRSYRRQLAKAKAIEEARALA
jgi:hypothetical protein